ncbi:MAG: hypothetical protein BKP49_11200 [Treponema sp. CETP13]|nr:MAG: hypothetical protein BKP49_11200 [Treponema sp. CETP13]
MPLTHRLIRKNRAMLSGSQKRNGYMTWWHSFTGKNTVTGEIKSFFVEIYIINPMRSPKTVVYGQLYSQKTKEHMPSYIVVKAGAWGKNAKQIHNFYTCSKLEKNNKILDLNIGTIHVSETELSGSVKMDYKIAKLHPELMSDGGNMSWKLTMSKKLPYDMGFRTSALVSKLNIFEMYSHVQGIETLFDGVVALDGQTYRVTSNKSFGYTDKKWGTDFANPWLWLTSNNIVSEITGKKLPNTCFDIGTVCPKIFSIPLKQSLFACFYYEGIKYTFNFSKLKKQCKLTYEIRENSEVIHWLLSCSNTKYLLDIDIFCKKEEMLFMNYEAPSGEKLHNHLWSGGTGYGELKFFIHKGKDLEQVEYAKIYNCGCQYGEFDQI